MKIFSPVGILACALALLAAAVSPEPSTVQVPIIMYHSLSGSGNSTSIDGKSFEADLHYLQTHGFEAVTLSQLADFVHHNIPLPPRPVVLTFDDGYYNNYAVGLPLAQLYSMPIVVSVIGKNTEIWSETPYADMRHGHVTWAQICEMVHSGLVEIANHTWDLHKNENGRKGAAIRPGEGIAQYRALLEADIGRLQAALKEHCNITPIGFVYPFGATCPEATDILAEMGFLVTLSPHDGINTLTHGDTACLYNLRRYNRTPGRSVEAILTPLQRQSSVAQS